MARDNEISTLALLGLATVCGLSVANVYFNQALLPMLATVLQVGTGEISWIATASQLGYALGMLLIVPLGDRLDPRRLCQALLAWTALMLGLASVAQSLAGLAALSALVCMGTCIPQVLLPYLAGLSSPGQRSRNIALLQTGLVVGILMSRSLAGLVSEHWGWQAVYRCAALGMLACAVLLPGLIRARADSGKALGYRQLMRSMAGLLRDEPLLRLSCVLGASLFAGFSAFWSVIAFKLQAAPLNLGSADIGLYSFCGALAGLLTPMAGKLCDRYGTVAMSILSILLACLAFTLLLGFAQMSVLLLGANLLCFALQLGQVCNQSRIFNLGAEYRSRLNTVYMVCNFCGGALGSAMGGWLWQQAQWKGPLLFGLACSLIAALTLFTMLRPAPRRLPSH
ncbi:MFS transporter [Pseudomonas sp. UFMG81]|uniref:MFS transporter n=1 Tax=Pseudomonas sp. UFMG81 TaxID=2745936 RepID=UPI00188E1D1E|nr:MFS transporter [Pseudomonas sp. UFMG81]